MIVSLIVAMAENRAIGKENRIPWDLPADRRRFRELTMGHTLIMGRNTFESIGRSLPGRRIIVLTRSPGYGAPGCVTVPDLDAALAACRGEEEVFVCGGAGVYREALGRANRVYLTVIHREIAGDTFFPSLGDEFVATEEEPLPGRLPATFIVFSRKGRE